MLLCLCLPTDLAMQLHVYDISFPDNDTGHLLTYRMKHQSYVLMLTFVDCFYLKNGPF